MGSNGLVELIKAVIYNNWITTGWGRAYHEYKTDGKSLRSQIWETFREYKEPESELVTWAVGEKV